MKSKNVLRRVKYVNKKSTFKVVWTCNKDERGTTNKTGFEQMSDRKKRQRQDPNYMDLGNKGEFGINGNLKLNSLTQDKKNGEKSWVFKAFRLLLYEFHLGITKFY